MRLLRPTAPASSIAISSCAWPRQAAPPSPVTPPAGQGTHRWPQFLDGRRFLFVVGYGRPAAGGLLWGRSTAASRRACCPLTSATYAAGHLLQASDGVLIAYQFDVVRGLVTDEPVPVAQSVGSDDGYSVRIVGVGGRRIAQQAGTPATRQLVWVDRTGKMLRTLGPVEKARTPTLSWPLTVSEWQGSAWYRGNPDVRCGIATRRLASRLTLPSTPPHSGRQTKHARFSSFTQGRLGPLREAFNGLRRQATAGRPMTTKPRRTGRGMAAFCCTRRTSPRPTPTCGCFP